MKRAPVFLILLFVLTFAARAWGAHQFSETPYFLFTYDTVSGPDQNTFYEWGVAISEGRWTFRRLAPGQPFYIAPLYALLLGGILKAGLTVKGLLIVQAFFSSLLVFAFYTLGRWINSPRTGLLAAILWCFLGPAVFYDACLIRASFAASWTFLLFWSFVAALRKPSGAGFIRTGLLLGVVNLLRPSPFFFLLPLWTFFRGGTLTRRRRAAYALLVFAAACLAISPAALRNASASGKFVPIAAQGADAFWLGNAPDSLGVSYFPTPRSAGLLAESGNNMLRSIPIWLREITKTPGAYLSLYLRKIRMVFNDYEISANYSYYVFGRLVGWTGVFFLTLIWILPPAALGAFPSKRIPFHRDLVFFTVVLSLSAVLIHIQSRYRFPAYPFFVFFAALGAARLARAWRRGRIVKAAGSLVLMALLALWVRPFPTYESVFFGTSGGRNATHATPIRDIDYITWITSLLIHRGSRARTEIDAITREARGYYGDAFVVKFNQSLNQLRPKE